MSRIFSLSPDEFSFTAVTFAATIGHDLSAEQKNALGNFLMLVGQYLATAASQEDFLDNNKRL